MTLKLSSNDNWCGITHLCITKPSLLLLVWSVLHNTALPVKMPELYSGSQSFIRSPNLTWKGSLNAVQNVRNIKMHYRYSGPQFFLWACILLLLKHCPKVWKNFTLKRSQTWIWEYWNMSYYAEISPHDLSS